MHRQSVKGVKTERNGWRRVAWGRALGVGRASARRWVPCCVWDRRAELVFLALFTPSTSLSSRCHGSRIRRSWLWRGHADLEDWGMFPSPKISVGSHAHFSGRRPPRRPLPLPRRLKRPPLCEWKHVRCYFSFFLLSLFTLVCILVTSVRLPPAIWEASWTCC